MTDVRIDRTDFCVHNGFVREWGTNLYYDPFADKGYQLGSDGRRIAITSFAAFGSDIHQAREAARAWCERARRAWHEAHV